MYTCDTRPVGDLNAHCDSLLPPCGPGPFKHGDGAPYCHCQSCGETGIPLCDHGYCAACHEED
jgi:hypothetical protein